MISDSVWQLVLEANIKRTHQSWPPYCVWRQPYPRELEGLSASAWETSVRRSLGCHCGCGPTGGRPSLISARRASVWERTCEQPADCHRWPGVVWVLRRSWLVTYASESMVSWRLSSCPPSKPQHFANTDMSLHREIELSLRKLLRCESRAVSGEELWAFDETYSQRCAVSYCDAFIRDSISVAYFIDFINQLQTIDDSFVKRSELILKRSYRSISGLINPGSIFTKI